MGMADAAEARRVADVATSAADMASYKAGVGCNAFAQAPPTPAADAQKEASAAGGVA